MSDGNDRVGSKKPRRLSKILYYANEGGVHGFQRAGFLNKGKRERFCATESRSQHVCVGETSKSQSGHFTSTRRSAAAKYFAARGPGLAGRGKEGRTSFLEGEGHGKLTLSRKTIGALPLRKTRARSISGKNSPPRKIFAHPVDAAGRKKEKGRVSSACEDALF